MESTVIVIIVHYNNPGDCIECVHHVMSQSYKDLKVLILDNNSDDSSLKSLEVQVSALYEYKIFSESAFSESLIINWKKINVVRCAHNHGYGRAVNIALRKLPDSNGYFFLLNPDINLDLDAISSLVQCSEREEAVYGCKVHHAQRPEHIKYLAGFRIYRQMGTISFIRKENELDQLHSVSGGCLFAPISAIHELGYFPTDYFLYWEDAEWCQRAIEMGIDLKLCRKAIAFDKGSTTIGKGYLAEYYYSYNALKFNAKMSWGNVYYILFFNILRAMKRLFEFRYSNFHAILKASYHYLMHRESRPDRI